METKETDLMVNPKLLAGIFYESGIFSDIKSEAQAMVKILAGQEMGLSPIESMNVVYIVGNKIGVETKVFLARIKNSGTYDYSVEYTYANKQATTAVVTFFKIENGEYLEVGKSSFSDDDAAKSNLKNKQSYAMHRELMLFYRAASKGIKMYCPQFLSGIGIYEEYESSLNSKIQEIVLTKDGAKIEDKEEKNEKEKETI